MSKKKKRIKVAMMRVQDGQPCQCYIEEIENDLKAYQKYVGGTIQYVPLTDEIDIICNDEGKLLRLPLNRAWYYDGEVVDIFAGNIFACRHDEGNFTDIKDEDIPVITKALRPLLCTMLGNFSVPEHTIPEYEGERGIQDEK